MNKFQKEINSFDLEELEEVLIRVKKLEKENKMLKTFAV